MGGVKDEQETSSDIDTMGVAGDRTQQFHSFFVKNTLFLLILSMDKEKLLYILRITLTQTQSHFPTDPYHVIHSLTK